MAESKKTHLFEDIVIESGKIDNVKIGKEHPEEAYFTNVYVDNYFISGYSGYSSFSGFAVSGYSGWSGENGTIYINKGEWNT